MPTRLVEVLTSKDQLEEVSDRIESFRPLEICTLTEREEERVSVRVLIEAGRVEELLEKLEPLAETGSDSDDPDEQYRGNRSGTRITVITVDTMLPSFNETDEDSDSDEEDQRGGENEDRLNRFELYDQVADSARLTRYYLLMVALSSIVAAVGLMRGNIAMIVGAMVIAPLLAPNMALALSATLADSRLALTAIRTDLAGVTITIVIGLLLGWWLPIDLQAPEIASRIRIDELDVIVALAAGVAGALAVTSGVAGAMVGVMVAVALLPPLMVAALLAGAGYWSEFGGALLLYGTNFAAINLAGIMVFLSRGISPKKRYKKARARKAAWAIMGFWAVLLGLVVVVLTYWNDLPIAR